METTKPLTAEEIRSGLEAAIECRRILLRHGIRLGGFMFGLGVLLIAAAYFAQGSVPVWSWLFPSALAVVVLPRPASAVRRVSRLVDELKAAGEAVAAGRLVYAKDVSGLQLPPAA